MGRQEKCVCLRNGRWGGEWGACRWKCKNIFVLIGSKKINKQTLNFQKKKKKGLSLYVLQISPEHSSYPQHVN